MTVQEVSQRALRSVFPFVENEFDDPGKSQARRGHIHRRYSQYLALSLILTSLAGLVALGGCGTVIPKVCTLSGCCGPTSDACAVPQFNPATGALTLVPGSPFPAGNNPISLVTINNFLYVSNFTDGTISGYSINPKNGALAALAGSHSRFTVVRGLHLRLVGSCTRRVPVGC